MIGKLAVFSTYNPNIRDEFCTCSKRVLLHCVLKTLTGFDLWICGTVSWRVAFGLEWTILFEYNFSAVDRECD